MRTTIVAVVGALALTACGSSEPAPESVNLPPPEASPANVTSPGGTSVPCVNGSEVNIISVYELLPPYREKMLTPAARNQGIKVFTGTWDDNRYGSVTLTYWDSTGKCFLWAETLTLSEYSVRLGMSPVGISPFYEPEAAANAGEGN